MTTPVDAYCGTLKVYENRADQAGPPDRSEHRRAAGAAHRRAARSAVLPRRRPRAGRRQDGEDGPRDLPARADRPRHRPGRSARHRQVEPAGLQGRRRLAAGVHETQRAVARARSRHAWPDTTPTCALHDDDRDGRSRRCARVPRLRQDQHLRRLLRHARRARLPAPARRSRPRRDPRRRRADQHAAAAATSRATCSARSTCSPTAQRRGLQARPIRICTSACARWSSGSTRTRRPSRSRIRAPASGRRHDRRATPRQRDRASTLYSPMA